MYLLREVVDLSYLSFIDRWTGWDKHHFVHNWSRRRPGIIFHTYNSKHLGHFTIETFTFIERLTFWNIVDEILSRSWPMPPWSTVFQFLSVTEAGSLSSSRFLLWPSQKPRLISIMIIYYFLKDFAIKDVTLLFDILHTYWVLYFVLWFRLTKRDHYFRGTFDYVTFRGIWRGCEKHLKPKTFPS